MKAALLAFVAACSAPTFQRTSALESDGYVALHQMEYDVGLAPRGHLTHVGERLYGLLGEAGDNASGSAEDMCQSTANWDLPAHLYECPGSLFSMALDGTDVRTEHAFKQLDPITKRNADGYHPYGSLTLGPDGKLYGTTQVGGTPTCNGTAIGAGVLFSFDPLTGAFNVEHNFCATTGGRNPSHVAVLPDGRAYGVTKGNAGAGNSSIVWRKADGVVTWTGTSTAFGWNVASLAYANDKLHGMSTAGGDNGRGTYFTIDPDTLVVTVVAPFPAFESNQYGQDHTSVDSIVKLSDGTLIALRQFGGSSGTGILVRLSDSGIETLKEFDDIPFAASPRFANDTGGMTNGRLAEAKNGLLYGTSRYGGDNGTGVIFQVARDGSLFSVVHSFGPSGPGPVQHARPNGLVAVDDTLYGVTFAVATAFKYTPTFAGACE